MMLQTAPVLYFYPPTTGPGAKTDAQPVRMEFKQGFVLLDDGEIFQLLTSTRTEHSLQSKFMIG